MHPLALLGAVLTFEPIVMTPLCYAFALQIKTTNVITSQNIQVSVISGVPSCLMLLIVAGFALRLLTWDTWRAISLLLGGDAVRVGTTCVLTRASSVYADTPPWTTMAYCAAGCGIIFPLLYALMARALCMPRNAP